VLIVTSLRRHYPRQVRGVSRGRDALGTLSRPRTFDGAEWAPPLCQQEDYSYLRRGRQLSGRFG